MQTDVPFWWAKPLDRMTPREWEALCDRCGRCCLTKIEDADSGKLYFTNVACRLLDGQSGRCRRYRKRSELVPDCIRLTPERIDEFAYLPKTCAYRRLAEGKPLAWWHPLVSGDPDSVRRAGISVRGLTIDEAYVHPSELEDHIVTWFD